jgi:hypothetical protein
LAKSPERTVKSFSKLLPERVSFESFWSEALKLYTEDSKTDGRGWWPRCRWSFRISKKVSHVMAGFYFWGSCLKRDHPSFIDSYTTEFLISIFLGVVTVF